MTAALLILLSGFAFLLAAVRVRPPLPTRAERDAVAASSREFG